MAVKWCTCMCVNSLVPLSKIFVVNSTSHRPLLLTPHTHILHRYVLYRHANKQLKGSVKELNKFHNYETEKITRKASDLAEYIELFGSSTRDRHAQRI